LGIVIGLLLTDQRRTLVEQMAVDKAVRGFAIFLPNLSGICNTSALLQLMHISEPTAATYSFPPGSIFPQQMLLIGFVSAPIWIAGLVGLLICKSLKPYRLLGWCYVVSFVAFVVLHGKNYYLAPIYPMLLAAGGVVIEAGPNRITKVGLEAADRRHGIRCRGLVRSAHSAHSSGRKISLLPRQVAVQSPAH